MNLGELVGFIIMLFVSAIGIAALTLLLDLLFPRLLRRARISAERMPIRSALVGVINLMFFTIIGVALLSIAQEAEGNANVGVAAVLRLFAAIILMMLVAFLALGIAAIARWVGERLAPESSASRQIVSGILTLELASLAPIVGWLLVPLATVLVGYGAVIIALVWRREA